MSLPLPSEPVALRAELRAAVAESPDDAHVLVTDALTRHLSESWGPAEAEEPLVRRVVDGCRYESYLWVMGDRRWSQLADTLAGRVQRRRHHPAGRSGAPPRRATAG